MARRRQKPKGLHPAVRTWLLTGAIPERGEDGRHEVAWLFLRPPKARALWRRHRASLLREDPGAWAKGQLY